MFHSLKLVLVLILVAGQAFAAAGELMPTGEKAEPSFRWRARSIPIAISASLLKQSPNIKAGSDVLGAIREALKTWEDAAGIEFQEAMSDRLNVSPQGAIGDGVSLITVAPSAENALLFARNPEGTAATTRVFFDGRGRITEADIVLNPYQQFSTDGTFGTFDLQSALTHEIGHLLGLTHSPMTGSTMHEDFAKNGVFGIQGFTLRTLAEIDRSSIRAKYGPSDADGECCGAISGKLIAPDGRPAANVEVWAEDGKTGRVYAQASTNADGLLQINGLPTGSYSLYSQRKARGKGATPSQDLGAVTVENGQTASFTKRLNSGRGDAEAKYIGFNGQISGTVIPVNAGKTYTIYLGGKNLSENASSISFSSPFLSVVPNSITSHDFGDDYSVVSFEMSAAADTPVGEYSVFVDSPGGAKSAIVGGIAVRTFINPFSNFVLSSN
jgi:matrixin/carboxypeptidase family protein